MTSARDQAIGLFIFFPILTTITVSLRIYVRTRVNRGSFGWDDVALVVTYVCLLSPRPPCMNHMANQPLLRFIFLHNASVLIFNACQQIGLLLWVGLASAAFQYPVDSELYNKVSLFISPNIPFLKCFIDN